MPLNRPLRRRNRRLPEPPVFAHVTSQQSQSSDLGVGESTYSPSPNSTVTPTQRKDEIISYTINEVPAEWSENDPTPDLGIIAQRKSIISDLRGELRGVLEKGVRESLTKPVIDKATSRIDYLKIKQEQLLRAVEDYEAAGRTLSDAGLYSNSAISYGCAVLAQLMAFSDIDKAILELNKIKKIISQPQILDSNFFSLLERILKTIKSGNKKNALKNIHRLKYVETFSLDDQELIANAAEFLVKYLTK